ncbi:MAG: CotH kinase family protein [Verrucomicrobiales bacterium]
MRRICLTTLALFRLALTSAVAVTTGDGPGTVGTTDGSSELELWLKSDGVASSPVATWPDASGNGRHATQPVTARQPQLVTDGINGRPVVRFTEDFFESVVLPSAGNQFTLAAVVKPTRTGAYHNILDDDSSTRPMLWVDGLGNYEFNFTTGAVAPSTGAMDIVIAVKSATGPPYSRLFLNSPTSAATGANQFTISASKTYDLFNRDGGQAFTGDVAELIVYSTALTAAEINKLGWSLQRKYGLAGSFQPPFPTLAGYTTHPAEYTVNVPMAPNTPVLAGTNGQTPTGFTIAPPLPAGLSLDPLTGVISGTPTATASPADYTVTASFSGHPDTSTILSLSVASPVFLGYGPSSMVLTRGRAIAPLEPIITGGPATGFSVSPPLPIGLILDPVTGTIAGTPAAVTPASNFTATATFAGHPPSLNTIGLEVVEFSTTLDITEFMASNDTGLTDGHGRRPDWIELHNFGALPIDLAGWSLTDNASSPRKWVFPAQVVLPAGAYLVVFASGEGDPDPNGSLHTNFSLSANGEYLALVHPDGVTVIREFAPAFPPQPVDISFGTPDRIAFGPYATPSPGMPNGFFDVSATRVTASPTGRAFSGTLDVGLSAALADGAVIRFTINGTAPTSTSPVYSTSITLTTNSRLRARVFEPGLDPGPEASETYLKLSPDVAGFTSNLPIVLLDTDAAIAGATSTTLTGTNVLVVDADPVSSLAAATGVPDYVGRGGLRLRGRSSLSFPQKQYKFETWDSAGRETGVELLGMPAESDWVLHAPYTDKALMRNALAYAMWGRMGWPTLNTRFVEVFLNNDGDGEFRYADDYAGVYMLVEAITLERLGLSPPQAANDPSGITGGFIIETGPSDDQEFASTGSGRTVGHKHRDPGREQLTTAQRSWIRDYYAAFEQALYGQGFKHPVTGLPYSDYTNLASQVDYRIAREWSRNFDGGSTYSHVPRGGQLTMGPLWDYNWAFGNVNYAEGGDLPGHRIDGWNRSFTGLVPWAPWWLRFEQDPDWWQRFIDRWADLREGVLGDAAVGAEIDRMAIALSAGAATRHFTRWPQLGQFTVISPPGWQTRTTYQSEVDYLKNWVRDRSGWIDRQFPPRPSVMPNPGPVATGSPITLRSVDNQTIHFTTDGTDPRMPGGATSPGARSVTSGLPFTLEGSTVITARAKAGTVWGPPRTAAYVTGRPPSASDLAVTELAFHPADPTPTELASQPGLDADDFEFIEFRNVGTTAIDLTGVALADGIRFVFPPSTTLQPGAHLVVAKDLSAFAIRHGSVVPALGPYSGNLENSGESVLVLAADGTVLARIEYSGGWSAAARGGGRTLVLRQPDAVPVAYQLPAAWALSGIRHGTPSAPNGPVFAKDFSLWREQTFAAADLANPARTGPLADADSDGSSTWLEYALSTDPLDGRSFPVTNAHPSDTNIAFTFTRAREVVDAGFTVETSTDGLTWHTAAAPLETTATTETTEVVRAVLPRPDGHSLLVRLRATRLY